MSAEVGEKISEKSSHPYKLVTELQSCENEKDNSKDTYLLPESSTDLYDNSVLKNDNVHKTNEDPQNHLVVKHSISTEKKPCPIEVSSSVTGITSENTVLEDNDENLLEKQVTINNASKYSKNVGHLLENTEACKYDLSNTSPSLQEKNSKHNSTSNRCMVNNMQDIKTALFDIERLNQIFNVLGFGNDLNEITEGNINREVSNHVHYKNSERLVQIDSSSNIGNSEKNMTEINSMSADSISSINKKGLNAKKKKKSKVVTEDTVHDVFDNFALAKTMNFTLDSETSEPQLRAIFESMGSSELLKIFLYLDNYIEAEKQVKNKVRRGKRGKKKKGKSTVVDNNDTVGSEQSLPEGEAEMAPSVSDLPQKELKDDGCATNAVNYVPRILQTIGKILETRFPNYFDVDNANMNKKCVSEPKKKKKKKKKVRSEICKTVENMTKVSEQKVSSENTDTLIKSPKSSPVRSPKSPDKIPNSPEKVPNSPKKVPKSPEKVPKSPPEEFSKSSVKSPKPPEKSVKSPKYPENTSKTPQESQKSAVAAANEGPNTSKDVKKKQASTTEKKKATKIFEEYWSPEKIKKGLEEGKLIEGAIRINPRCFKQAFVSHPDENLQDILIEGFADRNRALEGDIVVLETHTINEQKPNEKNNEKHNKSGLEAQLVQKRQFLPTDEKIGQAKEGQMTGKVVGITSQVHSRKCIGHLKLMKDNNKKVALFSPRDARVPRLHIQAENCPSGFWKDPAAHKNILYSAQVTEWSDITFAVGKIIATIGPAGDIEAETMAILEDNDIVVDPYPSHYKQFYPTSPFIVSEEEIKNRLDLRKECIFTIDPATAKDLDDAVSCKKLENGNLLIGVHISDVSYFLKDDTPLDEDVSARATSIYLVDRVYHMLPDELCEICSLTPGYDKLAYSVIWEMNRDAEIVTQKFARTVINSCTKLAYEHVQEIFDNPAKDINTIKLPEISNGFTPSHVKEVVNELRIIAHILRKGRFSDGALTINQPKVSICLSESGVPLGYEEYVQKESHRLIEEFMLLANTSVAKLLIETYPDIAFLRCHPPPKRRLMLNLKESMELRGIHLDVSDAGNLQTSLARYASNNNFYKWQMLILYTLCAKPMARALYFCSGIKPQRNSHHYALSIPFYTHFTSPIRRYADIMVHRLLNAALKYNSKPSWDPDFVQRVAANCNKQKYNAKLAGELSIKLYLGWYVHLRNSVRQKGAVVDVKDHSFDVITLDMGVTLRVYVNDLNAEVIPSSEGKVNSLILLWKPTYKEPYFTTQVIDQFTIVDVELSCKESLQKLQASLIRPSKFK